MHWRTEAFAGDAHRHSIGFIVGQSIGDLCALVQLDRADAMLRQVDQVAARMCQPKAARRSPAASKCSAISAAFSSAEARDSIADASR